MAESISVLDTFQVKFMHSREVVAEKEIYTHLYTQKNLSNIHLYPNLFPFGRSDSGRCCGTNYI